MNKAFLGIDLGTSSVKIICSDLFGNVQKSSSNYEEVSLNGWKNAIISALKKLDLKDDIIWDKK